jgi:hypothetical protein
MADKNNNNSISTCNGAFKNSGVTKYIDEDDDEHVNIEIIEVKSKATTTCDKENKLDDNKTTKTNKSALGQPKIPPIPIKWKIQQPEAHNLTSVQISSQKKHKLDQTPALKSISTVINHPPPVSNDSSSCSVIKIMNKPPLPPKPQNLSKMKKKIELQTELTVNKLSAQTEQLRLEITDLKAALLCERNAVRVLR